MHLHHHSNTRPSSIIRKINPQTSTTTTTKEEANPNDNTFETQRFHNHLVKMMNVNHGDKVVGIYSDPIYYHWSRDEMLSPWNNNRFHPINHALIDKSYGASDEYVEWFCNKLQGNKKKFIFLLLLTPGFQKTFFYVIVSSPSTFLIMWCQSEHF